MVNDKKEEGKAAQGIVVGGVGGAVLGVLAALLLSKPGEAAPPEQRWDYLITCQETIIALLEQILAKTGEPPAVEVTVLTPWVAKEPEEIFDQPIRSIGTFGSDKMVNQTKGKRLLFKVESSLDQATVIQVIGNITDSFLLPTNIGPPLPCVANGNITVGLAWDDWHPFVGIRITTAVAPTTGILKVWAVLQC